MHLHGIGHGHLVELVGGVGKAIFKLRSPGPVTHRGVGVEVHRHQPLPVALLTQRQFRKLHLSQYLPQIRLCDLVIAFCLI